VQFAWTLQRRVVDQSTWLWAIAKLYSTINQWVTRWCIYSALEKDNVLRTYLANFWRSVQFQRSMWQVSPVSLPTLRWVSFGKTFSYASQKSLKVWHARYCSGILCHKRLYVSALRSPITNATIWRVRRQMAVHNQYLAVFMKTNDQTSSNSSTSSLSAGNKLSLTVGCSLTFFWAPFSKCCARHETYEQFHAYSVVHDRQIKSDLSPPGYAGFVDTWLPTYDNPCTKTVDYLRYSCHSWQHLSCHTQDSEKLPLWLSCHFYIII